MRANSLGSFALVLLIVNESVTSVVSAEIKPVPVAQTPRDLSVEVIKIVIGVGVFQHHLNQWRVQHRVHSPCADGVGEFILDYRAFEVEFVADEPDADGSVVLFHVTVIGADVHDAGDPASVTGRERAFVQGDFLDCLRLENREYAEHVIDIVDRYSVQHNQVLIGSASSDINA